MNKKTQSTKQNAVTRANGKQDDNTQTAEQPTAEQPTAEQPTAEQPTAEQPTAEQPTAEQPTAETNPTTLLATIGETPILIGDVFRLKADSQNETAAVEVNPTLPDGKADTTRNADKPNCWNAATREAYRALQKAAIGLKVTFTFTDDRRATITETATITGCGMDTTNDRATFTLSNGRKVASGYCFRAIGYDADRASTQRTNKPTEDTRNAADIRRDIADKEARRDKLTRQIEDLKQALTKALENDLQAIKEALRDCPTDRKTLAAVIATPTANRITPADADGLLQALQAVEAIPAAFHAVIRTMEDAHGQGAVWLMIQAGKDPQAVTNADLVAEVMKQHGLKLGDIPTDLLPE